MPPSLRDWLPKDHLAWFISDTVDQLDLDAFLERYRVCGKGEQAYPPCMMLKVLLYAYSTGVFSSRKIAAKMEADVAFRVLATGLFPDFGPSAGFARGTATTSQMCSCRSCPIPWDGLLALK